MADSKTSALPAVAAVTAAQEFAINDGGTSKKATALQIKTYAGVSGLATADGGTAIADNKVMRGDGMTGVQGSVVGLDDAGAVTGVTLLDVDNLRLDGNTLSSTNANGSIVLDPDGTGAVQVASGLLQMGGATSGEPALKNASGDLTVRAADDSGNKPIVASFFAAVDTAGNYKFKGDAAAGAILGAGASLFGSSSAGLGGVSSGDVGMLRDSGGVWRDTNGGAGVGARLCSRVVEASTAGSGAPNLLGVTESRKLLTNEGATAEAYNTLPSAAAGYEFVFYCQDTDGIRVVAGAGDTIRIGANVSAAAGFVRSSTVGSVLQLVAINATEWVALAASGTWTIDV